MWFRNYKNLSICEKPNLFCLSLTCIFVFGFFPILFKLSKILVKRIVCLRRMRKKLSWKIRFINARILYQSHEVRLSMAVTTSENLKFSINMISCVHTRSKRFIKLLVPKLKFISLKFTLSTCIKYSNHSLRIHTFFNQSCPFLMANLL